MLGLTFQSVPLTEEAVSRLDSEWADLADNAIEKNVFFFPWFVRSSIPLLKPKLPQIVTVRREDRLIGLVMMQSDTGYAKVPVGFFRTCLQYHQFLATPLIRAGHAEDFFTGLGKWLDTAPQNKSFCVLSLLSGEGEIADAATTFLENENRAAAQVEIIERAAISEPLSAGSDPTSHISKSRLKSVKRREKNLAKLGDVSVDHFSEGDDAQAWLDDFIRLENSGWKGDEETSIAKNPIDADFYRAMVAAADSEKALSFLRLSVDGVPIAYTLDLISGSFAYCLKSAHDVEFRKYAPGVILEYETLKKYHRPGANIFVDSCTAPDNTMINELWPGKRKIQSIAFARKGNLHSFIFKSVFLLKQAITKKSAPKWKER